MDSSEIYNILKNGSPDDRVKFVQSAPENSFKTYSMGLVGSHNPGMVVISLTSMIIEYCNGSNPVFGSVLSRAVHSLACEIYGNSPEHGGLIETTLSGLAFQHVNALNLLGRSGEVLGFLDKYLPFYESPPEMENLPSLYCAKANALLNMNRIDEAEEILLAIDSSRNPGARIEISRLLEKIRQLKGGITSIEPDRQPQQGLDYAGILKDVLGGLGNEPDIQAGLGKMMGKGNRLGPNDNSQYEQLLDFLGSGEQFLTKHSDDENEWTMQGKLREATKIFKLEVRPAPNKIEASLQELTKVCYWAEEHQHNVLLNDALWGIYLCYSRQDEDSKAADALISLRSNLERQRLGIKDPYERGGAFSDYPQLFNALCEKLQRAERYSDLLEAMEASKGRGIADILTIQQGKAVGDKDIYSSVNRLPYLTREHGFHYLSYYLDRFNGEAIIYQVLVGKDGVAHGKVPVRLPGHLLDTALDNLDPKYWGEPDPDTGDIIEDASAQLSPLGDFLLSLMIEGVLEKGDHICYTADENLNNLPLHYLPFQGEKLINSFTLSKIHSCLQLELILEKPPVLPGRAKSFVVPTRQDVKSENRETFHDSLTASAKMLGGLVPTDFVENENVSLDSIKSMDLGNSILHFACHGFFPDKQSGKNPFANSGLVISDGGTLPDAELVASGNTDFLLSPKSVILNSIGIQGSHVSMMSCVSGLSIEGLGGDALGMDWALTQAGAKSIISSHWMISAAEAAEFFGLFYSNWLKGGKSRGLAFRETINSLRSRKGKTSEAHCWAAFSLSGDWR